MSARQTLLSVALVLFGVAALGNGMDRLSRRAPGLADSVPRPFRAQADRSAATLMVSRQQGQAGLARARAAVRHDPVDPDSTALLGVALLMSGKADAAAGTFRVAARFGWRNQATQLYWFDAAMLAGDYSVAAERADALLRAHPGYPLRESLLQPLEAVPAGREALLERLRQKPSWLSAYLNANEDASPATLDHRVEVIRGLATTGSRLGCGVVANFATILINKDRRADAEAVWNAHCPARPVHGFLADPQFVSIDSPELFPFTWRVQRSGDVQVRREADGESRRGLVVSNSAAAIREVLSQAVALPQGAYRLRLNVDGAETRAAPRLLASVGCGRNAPYPAGVEGDVTSAGQIIRVGDCKRQEIGVWLTPGPAPLTIRTAQLEKID